jgi:AraC-like DNA-binding protein
MPGGGTSTFTDPNDYQANLREARLDLVLTGAGGFRARLTWATLHQFHLLRSEEELPRIAYVSLAPELVFVGFTERADPPMLWDGDELQPGEIIIHSRAEQFHQRTTGPSRWCLIGVAPDHLGQYGAALSGRPLPLPAAARILRPASRHARRLVRLHAQACRLAETKPRVLAHPEVARAIEQGIIQALVTCLSTARTRGNGIGKRHHERIMVRLEEALAEHLGQPLRMPELCALIGATDRTLRSCCTEFLGLSPSQYVLLRRLKQARRLLRDADPATASVAEIARECGFIQLGRFAGAYRTLFGETPSATLRQQPESALTPKLAESA